MKLIEVYRYWVSPFLPDSCRFYPSCSQYALEAYQKLGLCRATYLSFFRLLKCNPFHPGGIDMVPKTNHFDTECAKFTETK